MLYNVFLPALTACALVAAHGRVAVITGDAGGNTTALGIQGGIVPLTGSNSKTEVDTTVFNSKNALSDGLGKTTGGGDNKMSDFYVAMALSGSTLPQVSDGGSISGTIHIVTTDGAGPYTAVIDPTGTGKFSKGVKATVTKQVPGKNGNIAAPKQPRFIPRMLGKIGLMKRATNVNEDFPFTATIPAGTDCTGVVAGQSKVCLVKIVNPSGAGPFGGVIAIQIAGTVAKNSGESAATAGSCTTALAGSKSKTGAAEEPSHIDVVDKTVRPKLIGAKFRV